MHLLLEVYEKQILGSVLNAGQFEREETVTVSVQNDLGYSEALNELLNKYGSLLVFEHVTCSVAQQNLSLVPSGLFQVSDASTFLQFSSSTSINASEIDYSRLNYFNCVAVYTNPSWLKSVLIPKFPRVVIQHEQVHLLRKLEQISSGSSQLAIVLHSHHALLSLVKHGDLLWNIRITVDTADDVLYHILNGIEKMQLTDLQIQLYAQSEEAKALRTALIERKEAVQALKKLRWTASNESHLQFQELCV